MAEIQSYWSSVPRDILISIVKLLPARIDILRLRAVCRSFRYTIPHPLVQYPFPESMLTNTNFLKGPDPNENDVFNLTASTYYAVGPLNRICKTHDGDAPDRWLIKVDESNSGNVRITNPMTGKGSKNLSQKLPKTLNLLDYRLTEIGKSYEFDSADGSSFTKVVFSPFFGERDDKFAVMASYDDRNQLGMWRNVDQKWSHKDIGLKFCESIEDVIYYNHKFYALLSMGRTVTVDPKSLIVTEVAADLWFNGECSMENLVGSLNDLFLVVRYGEVDGDGDNDEIKNYIGVFKLNEQKRKWVPVMEKLDLVDRVLFVGEISCTCSVLGKEFPGSKGACVYYGADSSDDDNPGQGISIWGFVDGAIQPISVFPIYLSCFWPPPAWLK